MKKAILLTLLGSSLCAVAQENAATPFFLMKGDNVVAAYTTDQVDAIDFEHQPVAPAFTIEVTPSYAEATMTITPANDDMLYNAYILSAAMVDPILAEEGLVGIYNRDVAWYQFVADIYGGTWQEQMKEFLDKGPEDYTQESLAFGTDYYAYVFGVNDDCELITDVYIVPFRTLDCEKETVSFSIALNDAVATGKFKGDANITVTPGNDTMPWYAFLYTSSSFEANIQENSVSDMIRELAGDYDYYKSQTGTQTLYFEGNLVPGRRYYLLVFAYDFDNHIISDGTLFTFTMPTYVAPAE